VKKKNSEIGSQEACAKRPGTLLLAGVSGSLLAAPAALPAKVDAPGIQDRIKQIQQRLADPAAAKGIAGRLKIERDGELLTFANWNNWDNGWSNQGFNNY
jgi:hypothetical protein